MLPSSHTFEALGTRWEIVTTNPLTNPLKHKIAACIEAFGSTYSRFRADSLVTKMSKSAGRYEFPDDVMPLLDFYKQLYVLTSGKVTPLIGDALARAGYDADYSFSPKEQVPVPAWDDALRVERNILHTTQPVTLDVGAAGKGYLVDRISSLLDQQEYVDYVIDASGDLIHKGTIENRVGLEHPFKPGVVIGVIDVQNKSICASAVNRRSWGKGMHHIFDPDTGAPVDEIVATWVIAESAMIADGLATALFFVDPAQLANAFEFEYVRMHTNGAIDYNHKFSGELF